MSCNQKVIWPKTRKWVKKKRSCSLPGSNRRPCPCEGHVITTTLRKQVVWSHKSITHCSARDRLPWPMTFGSSPFLTTRTCGATDNALDYESRDCRFESCQVRQNILPPLLRRNEPSLQKSSPPGGLEPPTFRLTAERASRLRHGGRLVG